MPAKLYKYRLQTMDFPLIVCCIANNEKQAEVTILRIAREGEKGKGILMFKLEEKPVNTREEYLKAVKEVGIQ